MHEDRPALVLHVLPDLAVGGGQVLLLRTIRAMQTSRFRHAVLSVGVDETMREEFQSAGAQVLGLASASRLTDAAATRRAVGLARPLGPVLIHTNNTGVDRAVGQRVARSLGLPVVNTVHSVYSPPHRVTTLRDAGRELARRMRRASEAQGARQCLSRVVGVSSHVRETWLEAFERQGISPDRFGVIHPGLNLQEFDAQSAHARETIRPELGLDNRAPVVVCVTRLVAGKGVEDLVELTPRLAEAVPDVCVVIVGDGEQRAVLEHRAPALGVAGRVRFLGRRADVPALLAASDIFAFPSYSEGFGLAPLEAMAARKPVVAYDLEAYADFLRDGESGRLAPFHDPDAFARALIALLQDPEMRRGMGARGRAVVEEGFTAERSAAALADLYDEVLAERGAR